MRDLLVGLVLVATVLAGCSDGNDKDLGPEFEELGLQATATTGIIRGVVVDPAIKPIAGATVVLNGVGETTTTEGGLFGFDAVEPGTKFLSVAKVGYKPTQTSTEVVAGEAEPAILKVLLDPDPGSVPFYVQQHYTGFISCSYKAHTTVFRASDCDPTGHLGYRDRDDSHPWFPIEAQPTYYQSEMIWKATQEFSKSLVTIQWACDADNCGDDDFRLCNVRGTSPLVCRVTLTEGGGGGGVGIEEAELGTDHMGYEVSMFANCNPQCTVGVSGVGLALDQPFDVYNTLFHQYAPPADWLFVESNTVPSPP